MKKTYYRIELTKVGYLFIALCLGVGIAALNTGNNLLYLTFGMMLSFIILSGLLSNNTLHDVALKPQFPKRIFCGATFSVRYEIENRKKFFPSYAINVFPIKKTPMRSEGTFVLKIPPKSSEMAASRVEFSKRGYWPLPDFRIETAYPFGLLKKFMVHDSEEKTIVYPKVFSLKTKLGIENQFLGELLSGARGDSGNPYGIRQFVFGDSSRFIHWKSSAKRGELRIKEFEDEKRMTLEVDLRLDPNPSADPEARETAVSLAASFIDELSKQGIDLFLRINGHLLKTNSLDEMLTSLALCAPPARGTDYRSISRENQAIVISDLSRDHLPSGTLLSISKESFGDYA